MTRDAYASITPASITPRVLALSLGCALYSAGCGGVLDGAGDDAVGVDESEMEGFQAMATLAVPSDAAVYNTGGKGLNLRTGPSTGYKVIVTMPEGTQVRVLEGPRNSFYRIREGGREGWSHSGYLRQVGGGAGGGIL